MELEILLHACADDARTVAQFHRQTRRRIRVSSEGAVETGKGENKAKDEKSMARKQVHPWSLFQPANGVKPGYFRFAGFSPFNSFGRKIPSLRINLPSNHTSPPPHSMR